MILGVFNGVLVGMRRLIGWIILCYKIKVFYKWILVQTKRLLKWLKKAHLDELILETFILVLMESSTEYHGETLLACKNLFLFMLVFLGWQFWKCTHVLECTFWGSNYFNFLIHGCWCGCCFMLSWLLSVNKYVAKYGTSLRFQKNKG